MQFTVYTTPAPQGSMKAHVIKGRAYLSCDNRKTLPFRHDITRVVRHELANQNLNEPYFVKHTPVHLRLDFHLNRPASIPKKRTKPAVKPDIDKLCRSALDALTGVLFVDDGQVTQLEARKVYAEGPECVVIVCEEV